MKTELSILCVEDVPTDVAMLNHALREGGMSFRSKRVDSEEAFLHELQHNPPDVILSDHGLPSFDGFTALTIAREQCPEVPFIFVTGRLGEQIAIETLRNGATDYVLKSNLTKLAPTIQRALRQAEERTALKRELSRLQQSEECYRQLVEFCPDAFLVQCNGEIVFANRAAAHLLGAGDAQPLVGKPIREVIHPESRPSLETKFNQRSSILSCVHTVITCLRLLNNPLTIAREQSCRLKKTFEKTGLFKLAPEAGLEPATHRL
ncbi:MAG TPA: response regulator, partial [Verrucomicrobiae bacterium]|nr:response regulator [Verrucomicrobiae bacterium]